MMTCILDPQDQWLLSNDPELADKSASYLLNKRIREKHYCGSSFVEEITELEQEQQEPVDSEGFLIFVENLNWLGQDVKTLILGVSQGWTLAQIGFDLGISRQAVHKKIKKYQATIKHVLDLWTGKDDPVVPEPGPDIPFFLDKNQQLAFDFGGVQ